MVFSSVDLSIRLWFVELSWWPEKCLDDISYIDMMPWAAIFWRETTYRRKTDLITWYGHWSYKEVGQISHGSTINHSLQGLISNFLHKSSENLVKALERCIFRRWFRNTSHDMMLKRFPEELWTKTALVTWQASKILIRLFRTWVTVRVMVSFGDVVSVRPFLWVTKR